MKTVFFCLLMTILFYSPGNHNTPRSYSRNSKQADSFHQIIFQAEIQPIFETHCMPCHFPGGKMYDKLPFDKPETILSHEAGIFKRIKNEKEVALIKEFMTQQNGKP